MKHKLDTIGREEVRRTNCVQLATTDLRSADLILADIYRKDPVRAAIASTYLLEMRAAIREIWRVLSVGGYFVLVAAIGAVKREGSDYIDLRGGRGPDRPHLVCHGRTRTTATAGSTGRCNSGGQSISWRGVSERLAGPGVEPVRDVMQIAHGGALLGCRGRCRRRGCRDESWTRGHDEPRHEISDHTADNRAGKDRQHHPHYSDRGRIHAEVLGNAPTDASDLGIGRRSVQSSTTGAICRRTGRRQFRPELRFGDDQPGNQVREHSQERRSRPGRS